MARACDRCQKRDHRGKNIARARQGLNYRSPRSFKVNLHAYKIIIDGRPVKLQLCTKCLRLVKKEVEEARKVLEKALREKVLAGKRVKTVEKSKKTRVKEEKVSRKEARKEREAKKEKKETKKAEKLVKKIAEKKKTKEA